MQFRVVLPECVSVAIVASIFLVSISSTRAEQPVQVGSKQFTEGIILGEIIAGLCNARGVPAKHRQALSGTQIVYQALKKGDIDVYADYTGTIAAEILKVDSRSSEQDLRQTLAKQNIVMSQSLGFNNSYALGMKDDTAERLGIERLSDLADPKFSSLRVSCSEEFMSRGDGWPGLSKMYHLPQSPEGIDHNLAYRGLFSGSIDVTDLYSTDAEIGLYNLRVLDDDRGFFPHYDCVLLYRDDLPQRVPAFAGIVRELEGAIDNQTMIGLNARVRGSAGKVTEAMAASEYLNEKFELQSSFVKSGWVGDLYSNTIEHLKLVIVSLSLAILVAIPLGVFAAKLPRVGQVILGLVSILQTLPSMAVLVFMIPLLGLGPQPAIAALFLYSLLPIVRNTYTGLTGIPANLIESAEVLGLPLWAKLWRIELPLALRSILAGIKTAAVINVGTATIGALIGAGGYGQPILTGIRLNNTWLLLQGAVPAALMAIAAQLLFDGLEFIAVPKGLRTR